MAYIGATVMRRMEVTSVTAWMGRILTPTLEDILVVVF
jgi:hypothetical protein